MELAQRHERRFLIAGDGLGEQAAVFEHDLAVVGSGKSKVQFARRIFGAVSPAQAAQAGTESAQSQGRSQPGTGSHSTPFDDRSGTRRRYCQFLRVRLLKARRVGRAETCSWRRLRTSPRNAELRIDGIEGFWTKISFRQVDAIRSQCTVGGIEIKQASDKPAEGEHDGPTFR